MKTCCTCKQEKDLEEFGKNKRSKDGLQRRCRVCARAASAAYYAANKDKAQAASRRWQTNNPERIKASNKKWRANNPSKLHGYRRAANLKSLYGMTVEEYDALAASGCAICGTTDGVLHVDHDHNCCPTRETCGKCVRGILCKKCNPGLGLFNDDPELLRSALLYLQKYDTMA